MTMTKKDEDEDDEDNDVENNDDDDDYNDDDNLNPGSVPLLSINTSTLTTWGRGGCHIKLTSGFHLHFNLCSLKINF